MSKWEKLIGKYIPRKAGDEPEFFLVEITRRDKKRMPYGNVICPYCGKTVNRRLDVCEEQFRSCGCIRNANVGKGKRNKKRAKEFQEIDGKRFYKVSSGYWKSSDGLWMHRYVWEMYHGKLDAGYEIHHIDMDRRNNSIENLQAMKAEDHKSLHAKRLAR